MGCAPLGWCGGVGVTISEVDMNKVLKMGYPNENYEPKNKVGASVGYEELN